MGHRDMLFMLLTCHWLPLLVHSINGIHEQVVRNNIGRRIKFFTIYLALISPSMERG
jgi:hypothetical protein